MLSIFPVGVMEKRKNMDFIYAKSPDQLLFLSLMQHCTYSLVESFHGTLFSYIFEKQFWFLKNTNDNILDDRINDIMEVLDKKDRILHPNNLVDKIKEEVNYTTTSYEFIELKKASIDFLSRLKEQD